MDFAASQLTCFLFAVETLESALKAGSGTDPSTVYATSKFVQLLNALYWKRTFAKSAEVVAVSPGYVEETVGVIALVSLTVCHS